jgi:long-chain acyl-CoA synthetase
METINDLGSYTFPALLANSLKKFGDRPAVAFASGKPITYAEVGERIIAARNLLWSLGVERGDRVAIYGGSSPSWGIAYFAIVTLGAIAVPLLPDFNAKEVDACLAHSGTTALIVSERLSDRVSAASRASMRLVVRLDDLSPVSGATIRSGEPDEVRIAEDDTASIIYTSGTTGRSKGVELSHKNLIFTAIGGQYFQRINKFDVGLSILPMSHVYEFTIGYLMFFLNGACVYYLEKPPTVTSLLPALKTVRPTIMLSVPIIMEKIFKNKIVPTFTARPIVRFLYRLPPFRILFHRIAGRSLKKTFGGRMKFFGIGGSKVDPVVERFMKEARFPYAIGYGLTETSPLLGGAGPKATIPGCIGVGMPGIELKVYDPDPVSGVGELVVKGPNVMKGYYRDPELTKAAYTPDGWFRTGDLCTMKGRRAIISLKGRSKNMILGATGENIYPEDIEFVLNQHPFVAESLVVEGENRSLVALVQIDEERLAAEAKRRALAEGGQIHAMTEAMGTAMNEAAREMSNMLAYKREELMNEIKFFVNENVNRISRIDRVEPIDQFEKTASQKIKRYLYTIQGSMKGKQGSR